jgi:CelD/BcsL family acetyltransferase involved in cellulose biosynthesis
MSSWLESLSAPPLLARAWKDERLAALGFFSRHTTRRLLLPRQQLHLHQSGDPELDRIAIEFNGMLARKEDESHVVPAVLAHLRADRCDECILPGVPASYRSLAAEAGYPWAVERCNRDFVVDLGQLRRTGTDLLQEISSNSRGQIRRALRLAAESGPLRLQAAEDPGQALAYLDALAALDRERRGAVGAFASPRRMAFHRRLVVRGFPRGEIELLRAEAGGDVLGYLYLFRCRGRVSAYQAAYPPPRDNRHRPGLVMHYLAIRRALDRGEAIYDFLAGEARYKRSLGREADTLFWLRLQKPGMASALERGARNLKNVILPQRASWPAA